MDEHTICEKIQAILSRGHDVQIQRSGKGIVILEIKKEIQYKCS